MAAPRTGFIRSLQALYDYLDSEIPANLPRSNGLFWLCNASGAGGVDDVNHGTFAAPFATLAYAISACTAGRGDRIMVKAGHAETVADATTFAFNKSGVEILGLGRGNLRPTFTFGTANTATIPVSAASMTIRNCVFIGNFLSIAAAFTLAAATDFTIDTCLFKDAGASLNFLNIVKSTGIANTVDGLTVVDSKWAGLGTTSVNSFILTANDIDRLTVLRNEVALKRTAVAAALVTVTAGVLTNADIGYNYCNTQATTTTGGSLVNVGGTTSTGFVYENFSQTLTTTTDLLFTTTVGLAANNNRVSGVIGAQGFPIPAVDS